MFNQVNIAVQIIPFSKEQEVYALVDKAIESIHKTGQPSFMHLRYYRYLEHVGVNEDFDAGYRPRTMYEKAGSMIL